MELHRLDLVPVVALDFFAKCDDHFLLADGYTPDARRVHAVQRDQDKTKREEYKCAVLTFVRVALLQQKNNRNQPRQESKSQQKVFSEVILRDTSFLHFL